MGYDYYARQPVTQREDHGDDIESWGEWSDVPGNYLCRNIWGGARMAEAMVELGMAYYVEDHLPMPDYPHIEDFGCHWDDEGEPAGERAPEYKRLLDEHFSWHGVSDIPGIPVHKIAGSNDGWHVTALECKAALGIYRDRMAEGGVHPEIFRDDVIPFLAACADRDGFETH